MIIIITIIKAKGFNTVIKEFKQHASPMTLKLKCYKSTVKQYLQNRTFKNNQKVFYEEWTEK